MEKLTSILPLRNSGIPTCQRNPRKTQHVSQEDGVSTEIRNNSMHKIVNGKLPMPAFAGDNTPVRHPRCHSEIDEDQPVRNDYIKDIIFYFYRFMKPTRCKEIIPTASMRNRLAASSGHSGPVFSTCFPKLGHPEYSSPATMARLEKPEKFRQIRLALDVGGDHPRQALQS